MYRLIFLILTICLQMISFGQIQCGGIIRTPCPNCRGGAIDNSADFIPNASTPLRTIKLNLHYMLTDAGTGNFTASTDGDGLTNYNGYMYSYDIISRANIQLGNNPILTMPPNNSIANLQYKYSYEIEGIYFHNDSKYNASTINQACYDLYAVNKNGSINIFFTSGVGGGGVANMDNQRMVFIYSAWQRYVSDKLASENARWGVLHVYPFIINHEIGHNFSLFHTMRLNEGLCNDDHDDFCNDTPTRGAIKTQFNYDACCGWSPVNPFVCENNMMGYTGQVALSPCQLGRVHWTIMNELPNHRLCVFQNNTLNVTDFVMPQILYQARQISSNAILQNNEWATMIGETEVNLNPGFEVQLGATFEAKTTSSCP